MKGGQILTANTIAWASYLEQARGNRARERETLRHNKATEGELQRHNYAEENENNRRNRAQEMLRQYELNEARRSNLVNEALRKQTYYETVRHNKQTEFISNFHELEMARSNRVREAEMRRHNRESEYNEAFATRKKYLASQYKVDMDRSIAELRNVNESRKTRVEEDRNKREWMTFPFTLIGSVLGTAAKAFAPRLLGK